MSEAEAILFYRSALVAHARSMPVTQAIDFLRGALAVSNSPAMEDVRRAFTSLRIGDDQLELLAGEQMKLSLEGGPK